MSENVDLVRSIYTEWERGDYSSVEWAAPRNRVRDRRRARTRRLDGDRRDGSWRDFLSAWEGHRTQAEEYRELDDGRVLVLARATARGKTSGMEVGQWVTVAALFEVRDLKVARLVVYMDRDRALAELGLEE
jgi:ketosteroid isomerase-like protein